MNNLAQDSALNGIKADLWEKLQAFLHKTEDPRIKGNGDIFESYEPVSMGKHSWANYINGTFVKQPY
jgi:hypothetical protein